MATTTESRLTGERPQRGRPDSLLAQPALAPSASHVIEHFADPGPPCRERAG